MSESLNTHSAGVFLLGVHDLKATYTCTSADINNGLNDLPTANLIVGQGSPLSGDATIAAYNNGDLVELLNESLSRRNDSSGNVWAKMLRCTIYEVDAKSTGGSAVFRGYIVGVTELSRAGNLTVKALRVQCMGLAAILHISPVAGFRRTTGVALVNAAQGTFELPKNPGLNANLINTYSAQTNSDDISIVTHFSKQLKDQDVATKLAYLANIIAYLGDVVVQGSEHKVKDTADDKLLHILDCIFCKYKIRLPEAPDVSSNLYTEYALNADENFSMFVCRGLLSTLQSSSVLISIGSICTGTDVMMNLVPHFVYGGSADDFRMELRPSEAWDAKNIIEIPDNKVISCNTVLNYMEHLSDPQVLVVNYSEGVGNADPSNQSGKPGNCYGVYSPVKEIEEWARQRYARGSQQKEVAQNAIQGKMYKVRLFAAPQWLIWSYLSADRSARAEDAKTAGDNPPNDNRTKAGSTTVSEENNRVAAYMADQIAKALFVHLHGSSDTATFELTPDMRFGLNSDIGCLEDHIGSIVDIYGYRGMLQTVRYNYSSGKTTTGSYSITLSRVRRIDKNEEKIPCPLYTETGNEPEASKSNSQYWQDTDFGGR